MPLAVRSTTSFATIHHRPQKMLQTRSVRVPSGMRIAFQKKTINTQVVLSIITEPDLGFLVRLLRFFAHFLPGLDAHKQTLPYTFTVVLLLLR